MNFYKLIKMLVKGLVYEEVERDGLMVMRFNTYRFISLVVFVLSVIINLWMISRYTVVANSYYAYKEQVVKACPKFEFHPVNTDTNKDGKKN